MTRIGSNTHDEIVDVCHRLYGRGMVTATDGNVSVRLDNGNILTTRSGINKGMVSENDLVEVTSNGEHVGGVGKPSTEIGMHLFIYQQRPDVRAVVHAHPIHATGFATARIPLNSCMFPEVIVGLGAIPLAEYATPSTPEVAASLAPFVKQADAILLANHGVVTYGADLFEAYFKMEKVEHAAHITFVATVLGGPRGLTREDVERLQKVSVQSYGKDFTGKIACAIDESEQPDLTEEELRKYVADKLHTLGLS
ncbi:MAG TPA: class II aldolase family protein [Bacteroidetes bacterium]|jgi:L-fuculose-phosphate aldolase|nr:class II aldolase family protein [Bacteroidota bacterium]